MENIMIDKVKIKNEVFTVLKNNQIDFTPIPIQEIVTNESHFSIAKTKFNNLEIAGYIDFEASLILVSKLDPLVRQRFTIAHELGHWILHRGEIEDNKKSIYYRKNLLLQDLDLREKEANYFAANLLVPDFIFNKIKHLEDAKLSNIFQVSKDVIRRRKTNYL